MTLKALIPVSGRILSSRVAFQVYEIFVIGQDFSSKVKAIFSPKRKYSA